IVLAGAVFGLYGICAAAFCIVTAVCATKSLGMPFVAPIAPPFPHNPDILLRLPTWMQRKKMYWNE
ncbi:MAG: spore germination protein, partial [bacterium]